MAHGLITAPTLFFSIVAVCLLITRLIQEAPFLGASSRFQFNTKTVHRAQGNYKACFEAPENTTRVNAAFVILAREDDCKYMDILAPKESAQCAIEANRFSSPLHSERYFRQHREPGASVQQVSEVIGV